jgi:ATP-dependent helicase/nuclease subunit B
MSVTEIRKWLLDPYTIYAEKILQLKPLRDINESLTDADFGSFIHSALEYFDSCYKTYPTKTEQLVKLLDFGREYLASFNVTEDIKIFWFSRFVRIAEWFVEFENEARLDKHKVILVETKGVINITDNFVLLGKADRLEYAYYGSNYKINIIDYKTGMVPTNSAIRTGAEPQLPLLAIIAQQREGSGEVANLSYIRLTGREPVAEQTTLKMDIQELIRNTKEGLEALVHEFNKEETAYIATNKLGPNNDYAHLERAEEWRFWGSLYL